MYYRAIDPFPLESPEQNRLAHFYASLGQGRLVTTRCTGCGRTAWPPRGFCPACRGDAYEWTELAPEGLVHAFTVQETGLPAGFDGPRVFAIVKVDGHRIFTVLTGPDAASVAVGQRVRLAPLRVADEPKGTPRWLPAFAPVSDGRG
jgi:uncharacterized OB-fold protein